jgi:predicted amidohydrolase
MDNLTITSIQTHLYWEDSVSNIAHFDAKIKAINESTDIIVLPEMFTTGFTMNPKLFAEEHGGMGLQWMTKKAIEKNCVIVGSISVKENGKFYNRLYWVKPEGSYEFYDKRHLFKMGNEHQYYTSGNANLIIEYKGWKICPLICYDLRFPVWSRNRKDNTYDVLIYVANWPEVRAYPWKQLLIARAIENQSYVVGVNRIGEDDNAISHSGDSSVINPRGELISSMQPHQDKTETVSLSYSYIQDYRKAFPVILDGDDFDVF